MGRINPSAAFECDVGGVCHMCYFSTPEIENIINRKDKENLPSDGRVFPYIVHYLTTGDLIYPAHEGENYITALLQEMGRLDLVSKLFPNQHPSAKVSQTGFFRTSDKVKSDEGSSTPLRIRTKQERWIPRTFSRILRLPMSAGSNSSQIYRPPSQQNKGTTLVIIRSSLAGNSHIRVHGPSTALKSLIPDALMITTQAIHHHLNSQLEPSGSSGNGIVMKLEDQGFVVTVRSSRVEEKTGALITQWLLYRCSGKKLIIGSSNSTKRTSSLGKALNSRKTHSFTSGSKKVSNAGSLHRSRIPFAFGSDTSKDKKIATKEQQGNIEDSDCFEVEDSKRRLTINKYLTSNPNSHRHSSPPNSRSSTNTTPNSQGSSLSLSSSSSSQSNSSPISQFRQPQDNSKLADEITFKERSRIQKLSSQSFHHQRNINMRAFSHHTLDRCIESKLTNRPMSFSTSSIASMPIKKTKASLSLWNICSKSPIKKVLTAFL